MHRDTDIPREYREESAELMRTRMPSAMLGFLAVMGIAAVPELLSHPARARAYLASADGVFVGTCDVSDGAVQPVFRSVLQSDFEQLPLTNCWDFYVRKGAD